MLRRALTILPLVLAASGCAEFSYFRDGAATALATPGTAPLRACPSITAPTGGCYNDERGLIV